MQGNSVQATGHYLNCPSQSWDTGKFSPGCALLSHYAADFRHGGDGPPLVLIPGLAGGIQLVSSLATHLSRRFHVYTYQLRGEEGGSSLRRSFGLGEQVADLAEFVAYLRLEMPIIVGVSFGAVLGLEYAIQHPCQLAGLAVQGADVRYHRTLLRMIAGQVLAGYPLPPDNAFVNQFYNLLLGGPAGDRKLFEYVAELCWQTEQSVMAHRFALAEQVDLTARVRRIRVPTLLLAGDRDVLVSTEGLRLMRRSIAQARLVKLAGAGHLAFVTHPEKMAQEIGRFAKRFQLGTGPIH